MGNFFKFKNSVKQKVKFGIGLSILLLVISAIFSLQSINKLIEHQDWVNHTNIVLAKLESIVSEVKDLETGQRGFQITNDKAFLDPYYGSKEKVYELYYELRTLTSGIPSQQRRLDTLKPLIDKSMN